MFFLWPRAQSFRTPRVNLPQAKLDRNVMGQNCLLHKLLHYTFFLFNPFSSAAYYVLIQMEIS